MNKNYERLIEAKNLLAEARRAVYNEIFDSLDVEGKFAYEIAEELGMSVPAVMGALMSYEGLFERAHSRSGHTVRKTYALITKDGNVDMNKTVDVVYRAAKYYKR